MPDLAKMDVVFDTRSVVEGERVMDRIGPVSSRMAAQVDSAMKQASASTNQYRTSITEAGAANDNYARQVRHVEQAQRDLEASMQRQKAANDNVAQSFNVTGEQALSVARHLTTAAKAAYVLSPAFRGLATDATVAAAKSSIVAGTLRLIGTAAVAAGGLVVNALSPALAFISRLLLPIWLVVNAFKALSAIKELGEKKFVELNALAASASKAGVGTDTFQRHAEAAKALSIETGIATDALNKFNEASTPKGGEGVLEKRLKELVELGNFQNNAGVAAYQRAVTTEERYRAIVGLITIAIARGERLAALDLAAKFLPPEMLERLRASGTFLADMLAKSDAVKPINLISQQDIAYAIELKIRLDKANDTLENKLKPIQNDLTQLGLNYKDNWIGIVEWMAKAVGWATSLYGWLKSIPDMLASLKVPAWLQAVVDFTGKMGWNSTPSEKPTPGGFIEISPQEEKKEAAQKKLNAAVRDAAAVQRSMREATESTYATIGDTSRLEKAKVATKNAATEFDRFERSMQRAAAVQEAEAKSVGASVGEHARLRAEMQLQEAAQQNIAKHGGSIDDYAERIKKLADRFGAAAQKAAELNQASRAQFDRDTVLFSDTDRQIAQEMKSVYGAEWQANMNSAIASQMRLTAAMKQGKDILESGVHTFAQGLLQGKSAMESIVAAADAMATSLLNAGIKNMLSGEPIQMMIGALQTAGAFILNLFSKAQKDAEKELKRLEDAQQAKQSQAQLTAQFQGTSGSIASQLSAQAFQVNVLHGQLTAAKEFDAAKRLNADWAAHVAQVAADFRGSFDGVIASMRDGLGSGGPFGSARANIEQLGNQVKAFIVDVKAFGGSRFAASGQTDYAALNDDIQEAIAAGREFLLMQIGAAPELSRVAEEMGRIAGTAAALQRALEETGMSAEEAAAAIRDRVNTAMAELRRTFQDDLTREINDLQGRGYLNDVGEALRNRATGRADSAALGGTGAADVELLFALRAQRIIDEAQLTGEAFDDLIRRFPELAGVVHEFDETAQQLIRTATQLADARRSLDDRLFAATNDTSTLAGAIAAQERQFAKERLDEQRAGGDLLNDLAAVQMAERLALEKTFHDRELEEARRAAEAQLEAQTRAARTILEYINGLMGGPQSTLSPEARLAAAQATYNSKIELARTGNIDAQSSITGDFDNLLKAAQDFYGSAAGYQNILAGGINDLLALPAVQASTDPVVVALRDAIAAIQDGTAWTRSVASNTAGISAVVTNTGDIAVVATNTGWIESVASNTGGIATVATNTGGIATVVTNTAGISTVATNTGGIASVVSNTAWMQSIASNTGGINQVATNTNGISTIVTNTRWTESLAQNVGTQNQIATRTAENTSVISTNSAWLHGITTNTGTQNQIATLTANNTGVISTNSGTLSSLTSNTGNLHQIVTALGTSGTLATVLGPDGDAVTALIGPGGVVQVIGDNTQDTANNIGNSITEGMRALMEAARVQLQLLNDNFGRSQTVITGRVGHTGSPQTIVTTISGQANELLAKIVYNTAATANNIIGIARGTGSPAVVSPVYGLGGWVGGFSHAMGGTMINAERDEYVINKWAARNIGSAALEYANRTGSLPSVPYGLSGANDNAALISEFRALRDKLDRIERTVSGSGANVARAVVGTGEAQVEATKDLADASSRQQRQSERVTRRNKAA